DIMQRAARAAAIAPPNPPSTAETRVTQLRGGRPGEVRIELTSFDIAKMEAEIEQVRAARGFPPLSNAERRLLRLPLFQQIEKSTHWFSLPDFRKPQGYPDTVEALVRLYLQLGMLTQNDLNSVGFIL
ncbi:MAG: hypothetical protein QXG05_06765, partial [Nitrososphaerota archaeon]